MQISEPNSVKRHSRLGIASTLLGGSLPLLVIILIILTATFEEISDESKKKMIILPRALSRIARQKQPLFVSLILLLGLLFGQANCSTFARNRKIKPNEPFTLQPGETVETEESKLKIRLITTGRDIYERGEIEYADLEVTSDKSIQNLKISERGNRNKEIGDFIIELINADSFGKGGCELKISRRE